MESIKNKENQKPKIAIVVDVPGWALDNIASQLIKNLSNKFDFMRLYAKDIDNVVDIFLLAKNCQIIHFLWRGFPAALKQIYAQTRIANLGLTEDEYMSQYINNKIVSTEVYDHLLLQEDDFFYTEILFGKENPLIMQYAVASKKLYDIYMRLPNLIRRPQAILSDGVDLSLFTPVNLYRFLNIGNRRIHFGWVGNSKWASGDLKGINTIIKPAIRQLQIEGYPVELCTSDRQLKMIPHNEMPSYYAKIDCYICASESEGTPNPILEAMACGVPIISTNVGIVPEAFGPLQKQFILKERSIDCLKKKIKKLIEEPEWFQKLSKENQIYIQNWDWKLKSEEFAIYFDKCLSLKSQ